jgi:dihydroflavonol-4-reductase
VKTFLTGGTGFIGSRVAARLRERGEEVVALVRDPVRAEALRRIGCSLVEGGLGDDHAIRRGVDGCGAAIHAAAIYRIGIPASEQEAMFETNVRGTQRVLDAATDAGVGRVVYVSTANVFGNTHGRVVDETYRRPSDGFLSFYDRTKFLAHQAAEERIRNGAPIVVVQPTVVYGPGDHSELGAIIEQTRTGRLRFISFPDMGMVMVHVDDVAAGVLLGLDHGRIGEAYVLGGEQTTMRDLVRVVAEVAGRRPPRLAMPSILIKASIPMAPLVTRLMGMPPNLRELISASEGVTYYASDAKARNELGWAPRDLRTGLREMMG